MKALQTWILFAVVTIISFNQENYFLSMFVLPCPVFTDEELWFTPIEYLISRYFSNVG
jgi:hypothetical protein